MIIAAAQRVNIGQVTGTVVDVLSNIANGPITVLDLSALNTSGSTIFLQVFDKPAASVTVGTTVPVMSMSCATAAITFMAPAPMAGFRFPHGCSIAATTTVNGSTTATLTNVDLWI